MTVVFLCVFRFIMPHSQTILYAMSEEQRRQLQQQLWNIANTLRGKMGADEFRDYILGFIFYKYLSEKIQRFADAELAQENLH
ncbi:MAG: type I restriction-modification system subunit M N-terminal domain-containing protein, partial [Gallionella sp.]